MNTATPVIPPAVPAVVLLILAAACLMFWLLVRQSTRGRRRIELREWAAANRFSILWDPPLPNSLRLLAAIAARPRCLLSHDQTMLVELELFGREGPRRAHLLVRAIGAHWPMTVLRPAALSFSALDPLGLAELAPMAQGDRFVMYGRDRAAAAALQKSQIRGLLPADVGLALLEGYMVLDFSARPFDPVSLWRIDALAEQLAAHLPAPTLTS